MPEKRRGTFRVRVKTQHCLVRRRRTLGVLSRTEGFKDQRDTLEL